MDPQKQQASERIKQANNILVTVSTNPSVDQLAACIGLTLALNKMGKHATAVFSGNVPSTLEFLQPEKTIEKNTDSLRDFIIALDKSKADKLRYKVEDRVVKIFITPYRTSIDDKDLEFSQGDFNVDVVLTLGVHAQADLDQAITSHGRILHDATIVTMNIQPGGELGSINWLDPNASSLSELGVQLIGLLDKKLIDGQIATAFLTGIVAETERFSNAKTSPQTMGISAELMGAGANQQLVATKLEEPAPPPPEAAQPIANQEPSEEGGKDEEQAVPKKPNDGTLEISHSDEQPDADETAEEAAPEDELKPSEPEEPVPEEAPPQLPPPQIHIDEHGELEQPEGDADADAYGLPPKSTGSPAISHHDEPPKMVLQPPTLGGPLNAASANSFGREAEGTGLPDLPAQESSIPFSMTDTAPAVGPTITPPSDSDESQNAPGTNFLGDQPVVPKEDAPEEKPPLQPSLNDTLSDIEREVNSSHLDAAPPTPPMAPSDGPGAAPLVTPSSSGGMLPPVSGSDLASPAPPPTSGTQTIPDMPVADDTQSTPPADTGPTLDSARDAVSQAIQSGDQPPAEPIQALNAQPLGPSLAQPPATSSSSNASAPAFGPFSPPANPGNNDGQDPNAPPPVPPPMMPATPPSQ